MLPDVLDLLSIPTDEAFREVLVCAFDSLGVAFQCTFTPSDNTELRLHANEEPARRNSEDLVIERYWVREEVERLRQRTSILVILFGVAISVVGNGRGGEHRCSIDGSSEDWAHFWEISSGRRAGLGQLYDVGLPPARWPREGHSLTKLPKK